MDNNIVNDSSNLNKTNDNSFTVLEDILYCSSPNNGIISKSNSKNKNNGFTQLSSSNDSGIHYTFNIITKAILDEKSESNEQNTNDYTILNILNSKSENIKINKLNIGDKLYEEEKNGDKVRLSKIRNDEDKSRKKKSKTKKLLKHKYNAYYANNFNKDKEKEKEVKMKDSNEIKQMKVKENYVKGQKHNNQRYSCINFNEEEKINKKQKGEFYSSSSIKRVEKKERNNLTHKMQDCFSSYHKKQNKKEKIKQTISTRNTDCLKRCSQLNKVKSEQIKYKAKKSESPVNKCKISNLHSINNLQMIKSSKFIEKRRFSLIKEGENEFSRKKHSTIKITERKKVKIKDMKLKNKSSKKKDKNNINFKVNDKKINSYNRFFDEFKIISSKNNKKTFKNIFRKQNEKKSKKVNSIILSSKKSGKPIQIENNKEFKRSMILNKNLKKKESQLEKQDTNKKFRRRYTVFKSENQRNLLNDDYCNISSSEDSEKSCNTGYSQEAKPIKKELFPDIKIKNMKIGQITEDKLVLNYNDKKEIIEILSDKEKINDYYEYFDLCLETLKEINIKEVPKSKSKINFKFSKERQKKKIALFDLDETLVHCTGEIKNDNYPENNQKVKTHKIKVILPNKKEIFIGINIRPHWKESIDKIKDIYNIVIFTASHQSYSDAVLNYLDPENKYFNYRLYRDSCVQCKTNDINFYVKDLDIFKDNYDLKDIIMIDNSILSFAYHLNNGIPVVPFYDSTEDSELPLLSFYLLSISSYKDLREANKEHINMEYFFSNNKNEKYAPNKEISEIHEIEYKKECNSQNRSMYKSNKEVNNITIGEIEKSEGINKRRRSNSVVIYDISIRNSNINNDFKISDKINESINYFHSISAKKLNNILSVSKKESKLTIFNAMRVESSKINVDFLQKWKNAYLKLSLKK